MSAVEGLVDALTSIAATTKPSASVEVDGPDDICRCGYYVDCCADTCPGRIARAALAAFREGKPLRDDLSLRARAGEFVVGYPVKAQAELAASRKLAEENGLALENALMGLEQKGEQLAQARRLLHEMRGLLETAQECAEAGSVPTAAWMIAVSRAIGREAPPDDPEGR